MKRTGRVKKIPMYDRMYAILDSEGIKELEFGRSYQPAPDEIKAVFEEYLEDGAFQFTTDKEIKEAYRRVSQSKPKPKIAKKKGATGKKKKIRR